MYPLSLSLRPAARKGPACPLPPSAVTALLIFLFSFFLLPRSAEAFPGSVCSGAHVRGRAAITRCIGGQQSKYEGLNWDMAYLWPRGDPFAGAREMAGGSS
ncbi:hypothetical protein B0T22DRAFT_465736 [Podospora appendiculata]|uniref:Uncharacterized protein n=1 Tax=Podospora appendiculata TaxID=314037 RepID=A0AAE0X598_9PEZI|nr:hypothetical protein B0T22DRAFT_465736 [Podospora appendiculata]